VNQLADTISWRNKNNQDNGIANRNYLNQTIVDHHADYQINNQNCPINYLPPSSASPTNPIYIAPHPEKLNAHFQPHIAKPIPAAIGTNHIGQEKAHNTSFRQPEKPHKDDINGTHLAPRKPNRSFNTPSFNEQHPPPFTPWAFPPKPLHPLKPHININKILPEIAIPESICPP
jgi:hypothetical protein